MKRTIFAALIILLIVGGLSLVFTRKAERLRSDYAKVHKEKVALQQSALEVAELSKIYGGSVDLVAFTEALYGCARQAGIDDHEVITSQYRAEQQGRGGRGQVNTLVVQRLDVSLSGEFRRVVDYIDRLQKLKNHGRISHLSLVPGEKVLKAKILIDLYSFGEPHAR